MKKLLALFVILILSFLIPKLLFAQGVDIRCLANEGVWVKSDGTKVCFTCPSENVLSNISHIGVKIPSGCKMTLPGVFLKVSDYNTLKINESYLDSLEEYQKSIESLHLAIDDSLSNTQGILNKQIEKNIQYESIVQEEKEKRIREEGKKNTYFWVSIVLGVVVVGETLALIF